MPKWDDDDELAPEKPAEPVREPSPRPVETAASAEPARVVTAEPESAWSAATEPSPPPAASSEASVPDDGSKFIVKDTTLSLLSGSRRDLLATRIGILGGRGVGKSYLFQALVHSTTPDGLLHRYLRGAGASRLWHSLAMREDEPTLIGKAEFQAAYREWRRLPSTQRNEQRWYTLRLNFGTGLWGKKQWNLDIDFLDGSGELMEAGFAVPAMRKVWERAFSKATIMVFCLPLWAMFPDATVMQDHDWNDRDRLLDRFTRLVDTYQEIREPGLSVRSFLALTMADDRRGALRTLRSRWLDPLTGNARNSQLRNLKSPQGISRYLASAREVSNYVYKEIDECEDPRVRQIPLQLTFSEPPRIVPVTAIDGDQLNAIESQRSAGSASGLPMPRPAHVELPLLAAMCECQNALM